MSKNEKIQKIFQKYLTYDKNIDKNRFSNILRRDIIGNMEISAILKRLRIDAGKTQKQLSYDLSIGQATISQWESGASKPTADALIALSKYYGVSADFILGTSKDKDGDGKLSEDVEECIALFDNLTNFQRSIVKEVMKQFKTFD